MIQFRVSFFQKVDFGEVFGSESHIEKNSAKKLVDQNTFSFKPCWIKNGPPLYNIFSWLIDYESTVYKIFFHYV